MTEDERDTIDSVISQLEELRDKTTQAEEENDRLWSIIIEAENGGSRMTDLARRKCDQRWVEFGAGCISDTEEFKYIRHGCPFCFAVENKNGSRIPHRECPVFTDDGEPRDKPLPRR